MEIFRFYLKGRENFLVCRFSSACALTKLGLIFHPTGLKNDIYGEEFLSQYDDEQIWRVQELRKELLKS